MAKIAVLAAVKKSIWGPDISGENCACMCVRVTRFSDYGLGGGGKKKEEDARLKSSVALDEREITAALRGHDYDRESVFQTLTRFGHSATSIVPLQGHFWFVLRTSTNATSRCMDLCHNFLSFSPTRQLFNSFVQK